MSRSEQSPSMKVYIVLHFHSFPKVHLWGLAPHHPNPSSPWAPSLDDICFIMILCCSINNYPFSSLLFKNPLHICERSKSAFSSFSYGWWSLRTSPQRIVSTIYRYANIVWFSKYRWNIVIAFFFTISHDIFKPFFTNFYLFLIIKNSIFGNTLWFQSSKNDFISIALAMLF